MAENKEYMSAPDESGSIHISEDVVASIATSAATEVEGVAGLAAGGGNMSDFMKKGGAKTARGVKITLEESTLTIELYLIVKYGAVIPEVAQKVQNAVAAAVEAMTGYSVAAVNVHVTGVKLD